MILARQTLEWSGPLPPPQVLQGFEDVAPGSAKMIVEEFATEAHHRREQEKKQGSLIVIDTLLGRASAIAFAGAGFFITYVAIRADSPWVAGIVGGGMIVSGMAVLLRKSKPD